MTNNCGATVFYKAIDFRSLLEAQWAVFFDSVSIEYRYRPARFPLSPEPGQLWYEPQFFLVEYGRWFEAFPRLDRSQLWLLSWALAFAGRIRDCAPPWPSSSDCYWLAFGPPGSDSRTDSLAGIFSVVDIGLDQSEAIISGGPSHTWAQCRGCGKIQIYDETEDGLFSWTDGNFSECCGLEQTGQSARRNSPALLRAYRRAQSFLIRNQSGLSLAPSTRSAGAPEVGREAPDSEAPGTEAEKPATAVPGGPGREGGA
jgi:hypothetical protein